MEKYNRNDLRFMYVNKPNDLAEIFERAGYTEDYIVSMFNTSKEEVILLRAERILLSLEKDEKLQNSNEKYRIPPRFNVPEAPYLKEDRDEMYNEMNNEIDKNIGETLEQIYFYDEEEFVTAIHRTSLSKDQIINEVFTKGLCYENYTEPDYSNHAQVMGNFPFMLREIKYCNSYKFSQGVVILKLPKKYIGKAQTDEILPLYYKGNDGKTYLRPEFISAYVPVKDRELKDVIFNTKINDIYNKDTIYHTDENIKLK